MSDKAEAVSFLQRPNEKGVSVYSHLTDVLATILASNPADALGAFEALSAKVKSSSFDPAAVTVPPPPPTTAPEVPDSGWLERDAALLKPGSEDEADGQIPPSLLDDARLLDAAGGHRGVDTVGSHGEEGQRRDERGGSGSCHPSRRLQPLPNPLRCEPVTRGDLPCAPLSLAVMRSRTL